LIGSLFAIGIGRLIDRFGSRSVLTIVSLLLGITVLLMTGAHTVVMLTILITLTRGLGQSALSVVSITIVGHWFVRRLSMAMAIYTFLLSVGFMIAFPVIGSLVLADGWRTAWNAIGYGLLLMLAPAAWLLVRRSPEAVGLNTNAEMQSGSASGERTRSYTVRQALSTPAFWVFALSSSIYGLIASGIALFNDRFSRNVDSMPPRIIARWSSPP
jgi:MFS family permease